MVAIIWADWLLSVRQSSHAEGFAFYMHDSHFLVVNWNAVFKSAKDLNVSLAVKQFWSEKI